METILTYIENVFRPLPQTAEVLHIKNELLSDMEAKFEDLRVAGISEHEATARVIGEFGTIDELLCELGIDHPTDDEERRPLVSHEEIDEFFVAHQKFTRTIVWGILLSLLGLALFLSALVWSGISPASPPDVGLTDPGFFSALIRPPSESAHNLILPLALFFTFVIPAVGLFIHAGLSFQKYQRYERGAFDILPTIKCEVEREHEVFQPLFTSRLITGVVLSMLAVLIFIALIMLNTFNTFYVLAIFLTLAAIPLMLLIPVAMKENAFSQILRIGDYRPQNREAERVIGAVAAFVFPASIAVILILGFGFKNWGAALLVFPVTAILFGGFAGLYSVLKEVD
ncbi:MAG: permease prefix domain 1-containing protein [Coriobacteriia bacterium]|nr:permease prefix domain 1-containing protein [Coriobacteriia bacterium]